jgi:uncharacterized protein YdgA (DUF945 family)
VKKTPLILLPLTFALVSAAAQEAPALPQADEAQVQVQVQAPPSPRIPAKAPARPLVDALQSAGRELNAYFSPQSNPVQKLGNFDSFAYTPATAAKLVAVFGNSHPLIVQALPAAKGKRKFAMRAPAWRFTDTDGSSVSADAMALTFDLDQAGKRMTVAGSWPLLETASVTAVSAVRDMRLDGRRWRSADGIWYGATRVSAASASMEVKPGNVTLNASGITLATDLVPRGKLADFKYDVAVKSIGMAGEHIEDFHLGIRINRFDIKGLSEAALEMQRQQAPGATEAQQLASMKTMLHTMSRQAIVQGSSIDIEDLSARYHGYAARLKGHVGLAGATADDAGALTKLANKIVAHIEVSVPLALFKEIGERIGARTGNGAKPAGASAQEGPDGQSVSDLMLGKMISNGYVRVDKDTLRSTIDFAGGALRINGKAIALPAAAKEVTPAVAAPAASPAPADTPKGN